MRRIALPTPVRFILVVAMMFALATAIDPYLDFASPLLAQAVNAVLPVVLVLLAWAVSGRAWVGLACGSLLLIVLAYANQMKVMYLNTDVVYADLTVVGGLLREPRLVLGFLHPSAWGIGLAGGLLIVVVATVWFTRHWKKASRRFRLGCLFAAIAGIAAIGFVRAPSVIPALHWEVFGQVDGARHVGVAGNVLLGGMTARDVHRPPDPAAEQAFWNEPSIRAALQSIDVDGNGMRPDIVVVQSESLFEPSQLCGFADTPVLKHVAEQQPRLAGNLHVPVFGGRTLQTEFEVLSGAPISYYPGSMFAYYELVNHRFDASPHVLDRMGYKTVAIHPGSRGYWRRSTAFPNMGFETFLDQNSFVYPRDFSDRNLVSDEAFTRAILAELDASDRPTFVMAISMDNHGPWGKYAPRDDGGLGLPAELHGAARAEMADYVEHAIDADNAYGYLLDALKRRGRPTVVVFYGDHLPALPLVYQQLCFKDGKRPEEHWPPYRIWANFPMPDPPPVTSAYLLQGWLMRVAGLPLAGHVLANLLAGLVAHDPAIPSAVKQRVLDQYANIAAANVAAKTPPADRVPTIFVGRNDALGLLMKRSAGSGSGVSRSGDGTLELAPGAVQPARIELDVKRAVESLTLRPYVNTGALNCVSNPDAASVELSVEGDGRELYRVPLSPKTFRLATLDLRGTMRLVITAVRTGAPGGGSGCDEVTLQVPQMRCFSAQCDVPGPARPPSSPAPRPSRILTDDPAGGDISHLASMVPLARRAVAGKTANLEWLIRRRTGEQFGFSPFRVQPDGRLFMHPADDHDAWIEFDVAGLDTIDITPRINPLDAHCLEVDKPDSKVGVVGLTLSLDGKPTQARLIVDRTFDRTLQLDVTGGHTLRIDVDRGNNVSWCDWFSVGFPMLEGPAVNSPGAAAQP